MPEGRYIIESAPIRPSDGPDRGVVGEGPVGSRWLGGLRIFRYELRCWRGGVIPDANEAVDRPQRLTEDIRTARRLLELAPSLPTPVWGRDELTTGDMWNSNSIIAWLIARSGLDVGSISPPAGGVRPAGTPAWSWRSVNRTSSSRVRSLSALPRSSCNLSVRAAP